MSLPYVSGVIYIMNKTSQMDWLMQGTFFNIHNDWAFASYVA